MEARLIAAACLSGVTAITALGGLIAYARHQRARRRRLRGIKDYNIQRGRRTSQG